MKQKNNEPNKYIAPDKNIVSTREVSRSVETPSINNSNESTSWEQFILTRFTRTL